tara:strand:- start:438 stop:842 length:405 start_codon:yes stop_codon:yes gene_type:complete
MWWMAAAKAAGASGGAGGAAGGAGGAAGGAAGKGVGAVTKPLGQMGAAATKIHEGGMQVSQSARNRAQAAYNRAQATGPSGVPLSMGVSPQAHSMLQTMRESIEAHKAEKGPLEVPDVISDRIGGKDKKEEEEA